MVLLQLFLQFVAFLTSVPSITCIAPPSHSLNASSSFASISPSVADRILSRAQLEFALDFYNQIAFTPNRSNVVFSPFSVHTLLSLLYLGLEEASISSQALHTLLHLQSLTDNDVHAAYRRLLERFRNTTDIGTTVLTSQSVLFHDRTLPISESYASAARTYYQTLIQAIDFAGASTDQVDRWVSENTRGLVERLPEGSVTRNTLLLLIHALYLKADWLHPFDPNFTDDEAKFRTSSNVQVRTTLMSGRVRAAYGRSEHLQCSILELTFSARRLALVAVLPDDVDGLPELENRLSSSSGVDLLRQLLGTLRQSWVHVRMPKFRFREAIDLKPLLTTLGAGGLFDGRADFGRLSGDPQRRYLAVDSATHSAVLEVSEWGAEGAAVSSVGVERIGSAIMDEPRFEANHPFVFFVWDYQTRLILFMGRMARPDLL